MNIDGEKLLIEMNREINDGYSFADKLQRDGHYFLASIQNSRMVELSRSRDKIENGDYTTKDGQS